MPQMPNSAPRDVLHLGAGRQKRVGGAQDRIVRVDRRPEVEPNVVWDLEEFPWPFADNSFDEIDCTDVLEHLGDVVRTMEEIHRVGRPGCKVAITTPHYSSSNSFTDPTHRQHLGLFSFDYFTDANQWNFYTRAHFEKTRATLVFEGGVVNMVARRIARRWPAFYERRLAWILPAWFISIDLRVVK